jgi:hypothetical protein
MGFIFKLIMGLFSGPLSGLTSDIKEAYQAKLNAVNDKERIAADERLAILEARKSTILASQSSPVERWVRFGFAIPFVIYNAKLVLWDKVLSLGVTDPLGPELVNIYMIVLSGFFIDATVSKVTRIMKK